MKRFNVTGVCVPGKHYMVDISIKLAQIKAMVDYGDYFTINRARQYGKTTTLSILEEKLQDEYRVVSISFERFGQKSFETPDAFCRTFMTFTQRALAFVDVTDEYRGLWLNEDVEDFDALSIHITNMCSPDTLGIGKKLVLMIDEVDKTSDNRIFLHFLGILRDKYLERAKNKDFTFHSVILAGVYDIKNIKLKMINEGAYTPAETENRLYNSPWNIAADFRVDMSFDPSEIATMLAEYEAEYETSMDIPAIADEIFRFTSGYPFLVSRICKCIDEELGRDWTFNGVGRAVQIMLREKNTLFDDMVKNIESNEGLRTFLNNLLIVGKEYDFNIDDPIIDLGSIYGYLKENEHNKAKVANRIFEVRICNFFISKAATSTNQITGILQRDVVDGDRFDMELCLRKFAEHYAEIYSERDAEFIEREGRLIFLSYLKPLINGQGFYHMESQFTDFRRMDLVVDFASEQFILELKLWKGEAEHEKAYEQLAGYLESKNTSTGYLLTFDFRKDANKQIYAKWVEYGEKQIFDVVI